MLNTKWFFLWVLCLGLTPLFGQSELPTHNVSIFKDGTGFFVRSGTVPVADKKYSVSQKEIPQALYGTFWFHAPGQENFSVRKFQDTIRSQKAINGIPTLLVQNVGLPTRVLVEEDWIEGKLVQANSGMIVLNTAEGYQAIQIGSIKQAIFKGTPTFEREEKKLENTLQIEFDKAVSSQTLEMMYLQRGISWFPSYLIELDETDKETARLTFRAEVANDAEDLEDARINFVVGVPNFRYIDRGETPLVSNASIGQILGMLAAGEMNPRAPVPAAQTFSNAMVSYAYQNDDLGAGIAVEQMPINTVAEGSSLEDLYFYSLDDITLPKGGRAYYHILTADVPVAHIYEAELPNNLENRSFYASASATEPVYFDVIHKLKVKNITEQPLTTGAAFVSSIVDGVSQPVSQDLLKYTPVDGQTYIKITQAPDIRVSHNEQEIEVETNAKRIRRTTYDLITVEGQIEIKNYRKKEVDLNVRRLITGNLKLSDAEWLKAPVVDFNNNLNEKTNVCWELHLKGEEAKTITYRYQIYVRN